MLHPGPENSRAISVNCCFGLATPELTVRFALHPKQTRVEFSAHLRGLSFEAAHCPGTRAFRGATLVTPSLRGPLNVALVHHG